MNLIKVDIQFEYIRPLRYSLGHKSSTKCKMVKFTAAGHVLVSFTAAGHVLPLLNYNGIPDIGY